MQMDILAFGTDETTARFTLGYDECMLLMQACNALRESRFPGVMDRLPQMFDEDDLARALGNSEQAESMMQVFELEQAFHQALHLFPGGHDHGHDHGHEGHDHDH